MIQSYSQTHFFRGKKAHQKEQFKPKLKLVIQGDFVMYLRIYHVKVTDPYLSLFVV